MDTVHDVTEAVLGLEIHFGLPSGLQGSSSFRHREGHQDRYNSSAVTQ